jgi:hypothetical protein
VDEADAGGLVDGGGDSAAKATQDAGPVDGRLEDRGGVADGSLPEAAPPAKKIVFVTSNTYQGNLGGLDGADAECQRLASDAGLSGTFKAWLSDSKTSASSRLTHSSGPYALVTGLVVANDWAGLTSGTLLHAIDTTERGGSAPAAATSPTNCGGTDCNTHGCAPSAWTNSLSDGTIVDAHLTCSDWTSTNDVSDCGGADAGSDETESIWGQATKADSTWSGLGYAPCAAYASLYCVEQ